MKQVIVCVIGSWILAIIALCLFPMKSLAVETAISVAPAIIEAAVEPGQTISGTLRITNASTVGLPISLQPQAFLSQDEVVHRDRSDFDAAAWITFEDTSVAFAAGETKHLKYTIEIPKTAAPGGHYAQISVRALSIEEIGAEGARSITVPEITANVFLTVAGDINETLVSVTRQAIPWQATPRKTLTTTILVRNGGNVHNLVSPTLLLQKDGQTLATHRFVPQVVLPDSTKKFTLEWQAPEEYGRYDAVLDYGFRHDDAQAAITVENFVITPSLLTLSLLAVVTWTVLYLLRYRRNIPRSLSVLLGKQ